MDYEKIRRQICFEAAQLMHARREGSFTTARWRAARRITRSYLPSEALPTDLEIRLALQELETPAADRCPQTSEDSDRRLPNDRFEQYRSLLQPLDKVRLNRSLHPEGDLLYHSLQVYELAKQEVPWDEDFLLAALLHDVGHGIDPFDAQTATETALQAIVSERTLWFILNLETKHRLYDGTIGMRAKRRLAEHEDSELLTLLSRCDMEGRLPGRPVSELDQVIQDLKELAGEQDAQDNPIV